MVLLQAFLYTHGLSRVVSFQVFPLNILCTHPSVLPLLKISMNLLSLSLPVVRHCRHISLNTVDVLRSLFLRLELNLE